MAFQLLAKPSISITSSKRCLGDTDVADLDLLGEFASQKLIDKAHYFRFIAEELVEFGLLEDERSHAILGNDGRCGWLLGQESDFADEVALLHVRDLRSCDSDLCVTLANKEQRFERLVFLGQRRALGDIIKLPGDEQPRNLYVVEAGEDTAEQLAFSLRARGATISAVGLRRPTTLSPSEPKLLERRSLTWFRTGGDNAMQTALVIILLLAILAGAVFVGHYGWVSDRRRRMPAWGTNPM